jgi:pyruvate dehydrogenase E2 component (dihydrolipoamide acetyltransferase)
VRRFISPIARRMLREADIDSSGVTGTGPGGRIVRDDVDRAIAAALPGARDRAAMTEVPAALPSQPSRDNPADGVGYTSIPHSRLRQTVAKRLTSSKQTVPHFYLKRQAVIDELLNLRKELNARTNKRLSVNDFVLRAAAHAHTEVPQVNAIWTDEAIRQYDSVDIAVAIASERGLVTPVLRSVEATSLGNISMQVREFVSQANDGKLKQGDLEGGSITITNLGMYGVDEFSAIISPPHSSILAVGAGKLQPVVVNGGVETATVMSLVLSVDHRAIDGALAAKWMEALVTALENPLTLLV